MLDTADLAESPCCLRRFQNLVENAEAMQAIKASDKLKQCANDAENAS